MNLEQYRAMVAQEKIAVVPSTPPASEVVVDKVEVKEEAKTEPQKYVVDGQEVSIEELQKGYMRTSDYTKKTQETARERQEGRDALELFNFLKANPDVAEKLKDATPLPRQVDPGQKTVMELESKLYDMELNLQVVSLQSKYPDFDVKEVLTLAQKEGITDLEKAYKLGKAINPTPIDMEALRRQIKDELILENKKVNVDTSTTIGANGAPPVVSVAPKISEMEAKVAKGQGLTNDEYIKWRDAERKPQK
jgi:hypothetical protein